MCSSSLVSAVCVVETYLFLAHICREFYKSQKCKQRTKWRGTHSSVVKSTQVTIFLLQDSREVKVCLGCEKAHQEYACGKALLRAVERFHA